MTVYLDPNLPPSWYSLPGFDRVSTLHPDAYLCSGARGIKTSSHVWPEGVLELTVGDKEV
jgi:hypothetical protein